MKQIPLTKGKFAIVDDEDFPRVNKYKWCYDHEYARAYIGGGRQNPVYVYLHRLVLNCTPGQMIDHKNRNKLDCRKINLRTCSKSQNAVNSFLRKDNTSGFRGVSYHNLEHKYKAKIVVNQKVIHLGTFSDPIEAAMAFNKAAKSYRGEFAVLNQI